MPPDKNAEPLRLQLSFDPLIERDICQYLLTYRKADRHGLFVHALRILMGAENFSKKPTQMAKQSPYRFQEKNSTPEERGTEGTEEDLTDIDEMKQLANAF